VIRVYPNSTPQAQSTTDLVNRLRRDVLPGFEHRTGLPVLVGGFTAASIDFSHVLASKLPLFFAIVILLSVLLLFVIFRSLVIPIQAAIVNLLTIGAALGVTVAVFQQGWLASVLGVEKGPIEAWVPVIMFAVVFGLSMDYEVFFDALVVRCVLLPAVLELLAPRTWWLPRWLSTPAYPTSTSRARPRARSRSPTVPPSTTPSSPNPRRRV
jgi:uncharacterized membrane protein YdfJ with MMPL/SSD domain